MRSIGLVLLMTMTAEAQLAPTGAHYAGRAADTGFATVSSSGGYAASVPLDLPAERGGLPVPVQIVHTGQAVGAAGAGWDVPISFVRRDTSFAHRRPAYPFSSFPQPRERVTVSLLGQTMDFIPKGNIWISRRNEPGVVLKEQSGGWILTNAEGNTYTFSAFADFAGTGFWPLTSIAGSRGSRVQLLYDIGPVALPGGVGVSIDLLWVYYNHHPITGSPKHEISLIYGAAVAQPLSLTMLSGKVVARMRKLSRIEVTAREATGQGTFRLRRYMLSYTNDADTGLPRLATVSLTGRTGSPEEQAPIPLASYTYGSATTRDSSNNPILKYQLAQSLNLPAGADATQISSSKSTLVPPMFGTAQNLVDVTGDGRADLVFPQNGQLWAARNRPGVGGTIVLDDPLTLGPLNDNTFTSPLLDYHDDNTPRYDPNPDAQALDEIWRKSIDVNGDGRIDVIDAHEASGLWMIYLNTPGAGFGGVKWKKLSWSIAPLYQHLHARGHSVNPNYIPLTQRFTARGYQHGKCWKYNFSNRMWQAYPQGSGIYPCDLYPDTQIGPWKPQQTFTEWELTDFNGDGYPDLLINSSRTVVRNITPDPGHTPPWPGEGDITNTLLDYVVEPSAGTGNNIEVMFNQRGLMGHIEGSFWPMSNPVAVKLNEPCGVRQWNGDTSLHEICGMDDVNGDGLLDRVNGRTVRLGTGYQIGTIYFDLPASTWLSVYDNHLSGYCNEPGVPPTASFPAAQVMGLRDLTGDGIPDMWDGTRGKVFVGTGAGFAPGIAVSGMLFSQQLDQCDGKVSKTITGVYDVDGDGRPEMVDVNAGKLDVYQLLGSSGLRASSAGRLVQVTNGHGAISNISWRSAKDDFSTKHQVPFAETVVDSVETVAEKGLGGRLSKRRYAYGKAELMYDPVVDAFRFPGYGRSIELVGDKQRPEDSELQAFVTVTDTYPYLAPFGTPPDSELFGRFLRAGRVSDVTVLSGTFLEDPAMLLSNDLNSNSSRIGSTHYDYETKIFTEPGAQNTMDCTDLPYPYEVGLGLGGITLNFCAMHGFQYQRNAFSWRGTEAYPSLKSVATQTITSVDDLERITQVVYNNDTRRNQDDLCVSILYAQPTPGSPMASAPAMRTISDCQSGGHVLAVDRWSYDRLDWGNVTAGMVTSHDVERYDSQSGEFLGTLHEFDATYDSVGNPLTLASTREDGATRTITTQYDAFAIVPEKVKVVASGVPNREELITRDSLSLNPIWITGVDLVRHGITYDGFGRRRLETISAPSGLQGVLTSASYSGFDGADPLGRRVTVRRFPDPASNQNAPGQDTTVYLDELGRQRMATVTLGADYANQKLVAGARTYDGLGRVVFEADPYPTSQSAATAYGTTHYFRSDGFPWCAVRGPGPQALATAPDPANEIFPTCTSHRFDYGVEIVGVNDAASLQPGTAQFGLGRFATLSAIGQTLERSTWRNTTRHEHATFEWDHLGNTTAMRRYQNPGEATNPVLWTWKFDSLGRNLELGEPGNPPRINRYSNWGDLLEMSWPSLGGRSMHMRYDALGRLVHREEQISLDLPPYFVVDPDTLNDFQYDVAVSADPRVTPSYVTGRLARATSPTSEMSFSYDAHGQPNAHVFRDLGDGAVYVEKVSSHLNGTPILREMFLPDLGAQSEKVEYLYDSALRLRTMKAIDGGNTDTLYQASSIDPFGRVRAATLGATNYAASYADLGRRLPSEVNLTSPGGTRGVVYGGYDAVGRLVSRTDKRNSTTSTTSITYDKMGFLQTWDRVQGTAHIQEEVMAYDSLGNFLIGQDLAGNNTARLFYEHADRDRVSRITYGNTTGNVRYDEMGSIIQMPTRTGVRYLSYFASGNARDISDSNGAQALFRYDAFGDLQQLDVQGGGAADVRRDRHFGPSIEKRDEMVNGQPRSFISRRISTPAGEATRRGAHGPWVFEIGEDRGNRWFTDREGTFVQDVDYRPYGDTTSTGAQPGSLLYSHQMWNGGDALTAFGVTHLGARIYDPAIGRFLSRDPLLLPSTATRTNPYAFAMNDPVNNSDPTGLDCDGPECRPPGGGGSDVPGGGPRETNPLELYLPGARQYGKWVAPRIAGPPPPPPFVNPPYIEPETPHSAGAFGTAFALYMHGVDIRGLNVDQLSDQLQGGTSYGELLRQLNQRSGTYYPNSVRNNLLEGGKTVLPMAIPGGLIGRLVSRVFRGVAGAMLGGIARAEAKAANGLASKAADVCDGSCFVAGTLVATAKGEVPIETLKIGNRVEANNPRCADEHLAQDTVTIGLKVEDATSHEVAILELARPHGWLEQHEMADGEGWITLQEFGISGPAHVTYIGPRPHEDPGAGCLVLMTINRIAPRVLALRFERGAELELTPTHALYVEGQGWTHAGELQPGQLLRTDNGPLRLEHVSTGQSHQRVYNLEVGLEHTYRVSSDRILAHNNCCGFLDDILQADGGQKRWMESLRNAAEGSEEAFRAHLEGLVGNPQWVRMNPAAAERAAAIIPSLPQAPKPPGWRSGAAQQKRHAYMERRRKQP
jgi:RHS repeat-associated protein